MSHCLVTLLLGSNLGNSEENITEAVGYITNELGAVIKRTEIMKTLPVEYNSDRIFCNIALQICTKLSPLSLLTRIKDIESKMGRLEDSSKIGRYTDRIIDIDIVSFGRLTFECRRLTIPHAKHLYQRDFSRVLLMELS